MTPRFPLNEAPAANANETMTSMLADIHGGPPPFPIIEENGESMLGPYAAFSYTPKMAEAFFIMSKTCYSTEHVKPRNRELAVLALCSVYDAPYMTYCHKNLGKKVGLESDQIDEALRGQEPQGLSEEESAAYCLGRALSAGLGPLDDATFSSIVARMEKSQAVGVANVIGGYRWIVTLVQLNGTDRRLS
ncbi:AhpD-like protein [Xylariomycetidae sp. FL0641]|nr:AhpD-like protein [Xylariomycetidae sp. FL0641]